MAINTPFPEPQLHIYRYPDPVIERLGYGVQSQYVERFWLPVIGPTALFLIRRLDQELTDNPEGFVIDTAELAMRLGVGMRGGEHGPAWRALVRARRFGALRTAGPKVAVRSHLNPLTNSQVSKLTPALQAIHPQAINQAA